MGGTRRVCIYLCNRNWLGRILGFPTVAFVAAPISVSLLLNLANRSKLEQQTRQSSAVAITEVEQKLTTLQQQVQTISYPPSMPSLDFSHIEKILDELVAEANTIPGQIEEAIKSRGLKFSINFKRSLNSSMDLVKAERN